MFGTKYLTYSEYKNTLKGTLTEDAFNLLEFKARKQIDKMTLGRLKNLTNQINEVKLCINDLISILNENNTSILSESADGYSIQLMDKDTLERTLNIKIEGYLSECYLDDGTPYLYSGVNIC